MTFVEELQKKSREAGVTKQEVIDEILNYFRKHFNSDGLERFLRRVIGANALAKREYSLDTEFWSYQSGCSGTHFSCGGCRWENPEDSHSFYYKGVNLHDIQEEVGKELVKMLAHELRNMGFNVTRVENQETWLKYYHKRTYFKW